MASLGVLFTIAIFVLVDSVTTNQTSVSKLPVFFFHGATGNKSNGAEIQANLAAQSRIYVALDFCQSACSVRTVLIDQVQMATKQIRGIVLQNAATYANGYHFLAHSQGASIARGVIMEMDEASDATPLQVLLQALGPFAVNKADFDIFLKYVYNSTLWKGQFQRHLIQTVTTNKLVAAKNLIVNCIMPPLVDVAKKSQYFRLPAHSSGNPTCHTTTGYLTARHWQRMCYASISPFMTPKFIPFPV